MELTQVERLLIYLLKKNGLDRDEVLGTMTLLDKTPQQIELIRWITAKRRLTSQEIIRKSMEISED